MRRGWNWCHRDFPGSTETDFLRPAILILSCTKDPIG